ncbi:putative molybdenum transport system permease protein YvgM [Gottschalkia purinilytica]|uniref:Molybdenum transport system permease n=1 Tax=Gottschalkia purinilytica TaxID=1503 RepID=A0A0L0W9T8_GOTPU|nr:molybdate ABC transporter permease subunit [Gottschalkia purinilytica]KNF08299.1 putative molybdenum transport system permease protein YvgM [Gottschalkia purinilytica]
MILSPILISIKVASIATIFTIILGVFLAHVFIKYEFKGKGLLEVLVTLPMVLPPSVTGYGLLILIGKKGLFGKLLYNTFGINLVFTWVAACIAATIVSLPLMYQSCKAAFLNVNNTYENAARTLGASEKKIFWKITLPLAIPGIISGIVLSFARAIGEFGATLMVAGNIPGKTETIPLAIYFAVETGNTKVANTLMGVVVLFSFILIYSLNGWLKKKNYK